MKILEWFTRAMQPVANTGGGGWSSLIREPFSGAWQRNREIRPETVLAHHAVYACVTRISQDIGKLRPKLVERDEDGIWTETTSAAFSPVLERPNRYQNHIQFKEWWVASKLIHGNAYALLERDRRQVVTAMYLLDPNRVTVLVAPDGSVFYRLKTDNMAGIGEDGIEVPASEINHDRMNCLFHPLVGTSPIYACGAAAGMGLSIQNSSSDFFDKGSAISGLLSTPISITPKKSDEIVEAWNARKGGVALLGDDMKFTPMRMSAADAQLIEQLQWTAATVAASFGVPTFKIGVGQMPTYQNGEILNQIYYSDCLQALIEQFELCMDGALGLTTPKEGGRRLGVELDLDGLLRMDTATQVKTLTEGIKGGLYTPNEARAKVDQRPLVGGSTIYLQHQDYPMEKVFARSDLDPAPDPDPPPDETNRVTNRLAYTIRVCTLQVRFGEWKKN